MRRRAHTEGVFSRILVGYDGSTGSRAALAAALRLVAESGGQITVATVQPHLPRFGATVGEVDEEREVDAAAARRLASEIHAQADEQQIEVTATVVIGHPAHELIRVATSMHADLIVLGHSGHSALWGSVLGSIADRVSHHSPCSVLIVR
jgi:nucleotide-binding universal stress UspA family protein